MVLIYKNTKKNQATKPDGYYFTFILDAKKGGGKFSGWLKEDELILRDKDYYKTKYFLKKSIMNLSSIKVQKN